MSLPTRLLLRFALTIGLVWALAVLLPDYVFISGGFVGILVVAGIMTILNILVRPILNAILLPLKLLINILAIIIVNTVFLWITYQLVYFLDPNLVTFEILGGFVGWLVVALAIGLGHWAMKVILK